MTADEWNALYPVGTPVVAYPSCRPEYDAVTAAKYRLVTVTRSRAWNLGHGAPVVAVDGYAGGIHLTHVDPLATVPRCPVCRGTFEDCTCGGAA
ncbi:hypothetical protein ABZ621_36740 [Streptomyces sp. NPDC007863]|uniref:hypothetical protein n=1 Tax=Streptomyces sp. NPDC007863 TaxID=3154894 RepID=UPI0033CAC3A9